MKTLSYSYIDAEGDEQTLTFPAKYEVCYRCEGEGKHVNPNVDGHGISSEEWERDWDEEEREAYFTGRYDVECEECKGHRVIAVVDETLLRETQKVEYQLYKDFKEQEAHYAYESKREREMGY